MVSGEEDCAEWGLDMVSQDTPDHQAAGLLHRALWESQKGGMLEHGGYYLVVKVNGQIK